MAVAGPISSSPIRRRPSSRRQRLGSDELQVRMRNYSFDSGHVDKLKISGVGETFPSSSQCAAKHSSSLPLPDRSVPSNNEKSREAAPLDTIPTLHHSNSKRDGGHLLSRMGSSKRRKNAHNYEREAEIKVMSSKSCCDPSINFKPIKSPADLCAAEVNVKNEIVKPHLNSLAAQYTRTRELGKRRSNLLLPLADSIDTAMPFNTEPVAYVISPFAALTPKPTLRYAAQSQSDRFDFGLSPIRKTSQKKRLATPLPESVLRANSRIDDLAQDMTASDLRELMERDARRRDRRRLRDEELAAYKSDQQERSRDVLGRETIGHGIDTASAITALPIGCDSDSQSMTPRHKSIGLGLHPHKNNVDPLQPSSDSFPAPRAADSAQVVELSNTTPDLATSCLPDSTSMTPAEPEPPATLLQADENYQQDLLTLSVNISSKFRRLARIRRRLANTFSHKESLEGESTPSAAISRKPSNSNSSRVRRNFSWGTFGALLRWKRRSKRAPEQPTYSNLSRRSTVSQSLDQQHRHQHDTVQPGQLQSPSTALFGPAAAQATTVEARQTASSTSVRSTARARNVTTKSHPLTDTRVLPKRSLSRFREDLPEYLMSPPTSRLQSPQAQPPLPTEPVLRHPAAQHTEFKLPTEQSSSFKDEKHSDDDDDESIGSTPTGHRRDPQLHSSYDSASMSNVMTNATRDDTPMSWLKREESEPSLELQQSLSLASIDSEGSWFSGRAASRRGRWQMQLSLDRLSQLQHQYKTAKGSHHDRPLTKTESDISSDRQDLPVAEVGIERAPASYNSPEEDDNSSIVMDDEYLNRLTRSSAGTDSLIGIHCEPIGDMLPSSDEEFETGNGAGDDRWGSAGEKRRGSRRLIRRKSSLIMVPGPCR